ncbi:MAG: hypothetical protein ABJ205_07765 [Erythrobacter sp.]|uniref:hypothetical protein n=1 Tax=Erythrobacter sp. TaxID=1042 RepID=UPI00326415D5
MEHKIVQATTIEGFCEVMGIAASGEKPNFKPYEPMPSGSPKDVFITSWAKSGTAMIPLPDAR